MYKDEIVGVDLPAAVELDVTETEPGIQGDRVSGARKPATLETGPRRAGSAVRERRRPGEGRHALRRVPVARLSADARGGLVPTRREARERALGLAYECEQRSVDAAASCSTDLPVPPDEYAQQLVLGVDEHHDEIDAMIRKYSEHWSLERMPVVDRALLRLGTFELGWMPDVPTAVAITEAVELAKQYSTKDSGRFVNGLLSRIAAKSAPRCEVPTRDRSDGSVES